MHVDKIKMLVEFHETEALRPKNQIGLFNVNAVEKDKQVKHRNVVGT